jgi:hypothetical protein
MGTRERPIPRVRWQDQRVWISQVGMTVIKCQSCGACHERLTTYEANGVAEGGSRRKSR